MRSAPIGLAAPSREDAFQLARDAGALTHGHPSGFLSAAYFAALIWDVARGTALPQAMSHADALLSTEPGNAELVTLLARTRQLATSGAPAPETIESLGGGWTGEEALAIALLCALTFDPSAPDGFQQALWRAALHSGDSDSTGSLVGNLIGAMNGAAGLPAAWLHTLELRDVIERVAEDLHAVIQRQS